MLIEVTVKAWILDDAREIALGFDVDVSLVTVSLK